jgi:hypothetical protein
LWTSAWPSLEIVNLKNSLKALEKLVNDTSPSRGDDVDSALARFLVVRTCGYVEQVVEICCKSYLRSKSDPRSSSYGTSWLGRGRNPSTEALVSLVRRFDGIWAEKLALLLNEDDERLGRELDFLVDRRNKIAHGLNEGIGVRKALDLVEPALTVADWFIQTMDPR